MPNINLLPWRTKQLQQANRQFFGLLGLSSFVCLIILSLLFFYLSQIAGQVKSNLNYLTDIENKALADLSKITELKKNRIDSLNQLKLIQSIFITQIHFPICLNSLAQAIPEGLVLKKIDLQNQIFRLEGLAQNNDLITKFMNNLPFFEWFQNPELLEIKSNAPKESSDNAASDGIEFVLTLKYILPTIASYDVILNEALPAAPTTDPTAPPSPESKPNDTP